MSDITPRCAPRLILLDHGADMATPILSTFGPSAATNKAPTQSYPRGRLTFARAGRLTLRNRGVITGTVTVQGKPVARPVVILSQSGEIIERGHSNNDGVYSFHGLDENQRYIVLSLDVPERKYNAAISDYVQPELL